MYGNNSIFFYIKCIHYTMQNNIVLMADNEILNENFVINYIR